MIMIEQLQSYIVEDGYENDRHHNVIIYDVIQLVHEHNVGWLRGIWRNN